MRRLIAFVVLVCVATVVTTSLASAKGHNAGKGKKKPHVCAGTAMSPGTLSGTFKSGVVVKGVCAIDAGPARVIRFLKVTKGSALFAIFGANNSHLTVNGHVLVQHGATLQLGCGPSESPCVDDGTKTSNGVVNGNITEAAPLEVIIHNSTIHGNVTQTGGGGGTNCNTPTTGPDANNGPLFSAYEDSTIKGNLNITRLHTCWLGLTRLHVKGNVTLLNNRLADADGIEVLSNHIHKNLVCRRNRHPSGMPPGTQPVWDSAEDPSNPMGQIFPRTAFPNTVKGKEIGQCSRSTPLSPTGSRGAKGSF
jgi:hypothetical protein